jgi:hypothetical protein
MYTLAVPETPSHEQLIRTTGPTVRVAEVRH